MIRLARWYCERWMRKGKISGSLVMCYSLCVGMGADARVWGEVGGILTMRVGEIEAKEEGVSRLEKPTSSFGHHRDGIESFSSSCPSSCPLVLILQAHAAITLNDKAGRRLCIPRFGRWDGIGHEKVQQW
jgi:hypothetical protein